MRVAGDQRLRSGVGRHREGCRNGGEPREQGGGNERGVAGEHHHRAAAVLQRRDQAGERMARLGRLLEPGHPSGGTGIPAFVTTSGSRPALSAASIA